MSGLVKGQPEQVTARLVSGQVFAGSGRILLLKSFDPLNSFNDGTSIWTVPRSGRYMLTLEVPLLHASTAAVTVQLRKGGASFVESYAATTAAGADPLAHSLSWIAALVQGDTIDAYISTAGNPSVPTQAIVSFTALRVSP